MIAIVITIPTTTTTTAATTKTNTCCQSLKFEHTTCISRTCYKHVRLIS